MKQSRQLEGHIRIADLRHKIVIKRIGSSTQDALGKPVYSTTATTVPARIRMKQQDETQLSDKETVVQMPEIVIRYVTPLTVEDWIEWDSNKYDIVSIDATRYPNRYLVISTKAVI